MNRFNLKNKLLVIFIIIGCVMLSIGYLSSAFGWYGYKKWEYRRTTFGNESEAKEREVFIKELQYTSSVPIKNFEVYIERGFKYGYHSSKETRLVQGKYPYQVSFPNSQGKNYINFYVINSKKIDSADKTTVFLKNPQLKDTLLIGINKYSQQWDSIGYIKVWDD